MNIHAEIYTDSFIYHISTLEASTSFCLNMPTVYSHVTYTWSGLFFLHHSLERSLPVSALREKNAGPRPLREVGQNVRLRAWGLGFYLDFVKLTFFVRDPYSDFFM